MQAISMNVSAKWVGVVAVAFAAVVQAARLDATVLPFEMTPYPGNEQSYQTTHAGYGDNVSGLTGPGPGTTYNYLPGNGFTPNVTVDYSSGPGAPTGHVTYLGGGWTDPVDYLRFNDNVPYLFTFTPDTPSLGVQVNSFLIELFINSSQPGGGTVDWTLYRDLPGGSIIATGTESGLTATPDRLVTTGANPYFGPVVLEIISSNTANAGLIGIDDLNFDQVEFVVPEPATAALLLPGLTWLAWRRRRTG